MIKAVFTTTVTIQQIHLWVHHLEQILYLRRIKKSPVTPSPGRVGYMSQGEEEISSPFTSIQTTANPFVDQVHLRNASNDNAHADYKVAPLPNKSVTSSRETNNETSKIRNDSSALVVYSPLNTKVRCPVHPNVIDTDICSMCLDPKKNSLH